MTTNSSKPEFEELILDDPIDTSSIEVPLPDLHPHPAKVGRTPKPEPKGYTIPLPGPNVNFQDVIDKANGYFDGATQGDNLQDWWMEGARAEIEPMIRKMEEYGGNGRAQDLVDMGRRLYEAGVKLPGQYVVDIRDAEDSQFIELAIYFYVMGKLGRWTAAINEGRAVSDDTLKDIVIYTKMLQRTREVGGWPV